MNKERAMELMGGIDPALIEEADLPMPAKRRFTKTARAVLIAACLCLALAGTAVAGNLFAGFHRMEPVHHLYIPYTTYKYHNGYTLWFDYDKIPLDEFSPELLELAQEHPAETVKLPVFGITQLELKTGLDLPDIPDSDQIKLCHDRLRLWGFDAYVAVNLEGQPSAVDYSQWYHGVGDSYALQLNLRVSLATEASPVEDPWITVLFPERHTVEAEEYCTKNGLPVVLFTCHIPETDPDAVWTGATYYRSTFLLDGAQYSVDAECYSDPDLALTVLKEFLENFIPS